MQMKVRIMEAEELNPEQKSQVRELWRLCREKEPVTQEPFTDGEENAVAGLPCFYLCYRGETLVSFLSLFIPDGGYAEGCGCTAPQERGKGYFSALLERAMARLKEADIPLYLVSDRKSADACAFIRKRGLTAAWEEWMMGAHAGALRLLPVCHDAGEYCLEQAQEERDTDEEDQGAEKEKEQNEDVLNESVLNEGKGDGGWALLEKKQGRRLGFCRLSVFQEGVYLYDFAIEEGERRKGYGRLFLKLLGETLDAEKTVLLQVGTYNEPACRLYEECGFLVRERLVYYPL